MRSPLTLIVAVAAALPFASSLAPSFAGAEAPKLALAKAVIDVRRDVTVDGRIVRLGDIFRNTGAKSTVAIAYAPEPGQSAVLGVRWLQETARRHGIDWTPRTPDVRVHLTRASWPISREVLKERIAKMMRERGIKDRMQVDLHYRTRTIHLPVSAKGDFAIRELRIEKRTGRFVGTLVAPAKAPTTKIRVIGRIRKLVQIAVLARSVRKGRIIRERDITMIAMPAPSVPQSAVREKDDMIGQAARFTLRAGKPIRKSDLQAPVLVKRGAIATIVVQTPYMRLTSQARALEDGARGETIRLRNTKSKKIIEGIVFGPDRVRIQTAGSTR